MIYTNEHYYLLCRYDEYADVKIYRIDLIQNLQMLDDPIVCPNINNEEFAQAVYAFVSKPEQITIRCEKIVLGDVLDKFGTSIKIKELCGNFFLAEFAAPPKGVKFWALQYLPYVEVLQPEWLRSEIVESIKKSKYHIEEEVEV